MGQDKSFTPTYYMKNLQFQFQVQKDTCYSKLYKDHFLKSWIDLKFTGDLLDVQEEAIESRRVDLGPEPSKKTLILDLDETLISCTNNIKGQHLIEFDYKGKKLKTWINLRPHLDEFLKYCSQKFELILFSSSYIKYVKSTLRVIDPKGKYFKHVIFRSKSIRVEKIYLKDLRIFNRDPQKLLIVDDTVLSFC